ncbi:dihydrofolate reductase [Bauldia litoralis]|uniref:dihydrofolate reductase n=1 Tax=Bauldia litoralis TaxID=665467 RepID=UPI0032643D37
MSQRAEMPSIAYVVARSYPDEIIGCDDQVPWRLRTDMRRFRSITETSAVIMGRKTFDSIGRPLPNRFNIVLSRQEPPTRDGFLHGSIGKNHEVMFVNNRESALYLADLYSILHSKKEVFVIGGSEIYKMFADLFYEIYLTIVIAPDIKRNRNVEFSYFRHDFPPEDWRTLEEEEIPKGDHDEYPSRFVVYRKKKDVRHRFRDLSDFFTESGRTAEYRARWSSFGVPDRIETEEELAEQIRFFWPEALAG